MKLNGFPEISKKTRVTLRDSPLNRKWNSRGNLQGPLELERNAKESLWILFEENFKKSKMISSGI